MTDADRQRLAHILGMLGSEHAGERAAAGLQAEAFRKKHGMTWPELLAMQPERAPDPPRWSPPAQPPEPEPSPKPRDFNIFPVALAIYGVVACALLIVFIG